MGFCAFVIFTSIAMTIGILTVYFTASRQTDKVCELTFKSTAEYAISYDSHPRHVVTGYFNADNYIDLAIANSGADNVGILLGYRNSTFTNQMTYATGHRSLPYSLAIGYFNNDTIQDIAVANYGTNCIGILLGHGNGSFATQITFSLGASRPVSLAVGDFNNDNISDIAVVSNGTLDVTILLSFGNGPFQIDTIYPMGYDSIPNSIAVADFNYDNQLDIAVVNYGTSNLVILLLNKNGSFASYKYSTGINSHPCSTAIADLNNDNQLDIAVANSGTNNICIFLGYGNGTFMNMMTYSTGSNSDPQFIVVSNFNNDDQIDIAVVNSGNHYVLVFKGNGNGTFSLVTKHSSPDTSGPHSIAIGDFDHDNIPDMAITNYDDNDVRILSGYAGSLLRSQRTYSTGASAYPTFVAVGDFNNDKHLDIVVTLSSSDSFGVFLGLRGGMFESQVTYFIEGDTRFSPVIIGDFNNDNNSDILVVMEFSNEISIYFGQGNGSFGGTVQYSTGTDSAPQSATIGDFNNDGNLDIVTANSGTDSVGVLLGYGNGTFTSLTTYSMGNESCPASVAAGDFNNDNILDFAVTCTCSSMISIHLGYGNGSFHIPMMILADDVEPQYVVIGDLNKDKYLDIVFTSSFSCITGVFLGYGDGTFGDMNTYYSGTITLQLFPVLGDFNRDTILDIAVVNQFEYALSIFFGYGNGTFAQREIFSTGQYSTPYSLAVGDFNNDNEPDIVVANSYASTIGVYLMHYEIDFTNETSYLIGFSAHPYSVAVGDFNNDNQSDIVVANSGSDNVQVLFHYDKGSFTNNTIYSTGSDSQPQYVMVADFNNDNQLDIAVANAGYNNIDIFLGSGNGIFDASISYWTGSGSSPNSIAVGYLNNDTWLDMVVANKGTDSIGVFLGFNYPTFTSQDILLDKANSFPYVVVVADFNNDSRWDIAVVNRNVFTLSIFLGYGNGTFTKEISYETGINPVSIAVGDFNNDNQLDIAIANSGTFNIGILLNYGNGTFTQQVLYWTSNSPIFIAIGDFNNDTNLDIVAVYKNFDYVSVSFGYGNGNFKQSLGLPMPSGSRPVWITVCDINNDTILDIVVANYYGNSIGILLGYGNGIFRDAITYSTGDNSGPCSIGIGDFNKDGSIDIAVANQLAKNIGVFFGYENETFSSQTTYSMGNRSNLISIIVGDLNDDAILDIAVCDWREDTEGGDIDVLYGYEDGRFALPFIYSTDYASNPSSIAISDFNNDNRSDVVVAVPALNSIRIILRDKSQPFGGQLTFSTGSNSNPYSVVVADFNSDNQSDIAVANYGTNNIGILLGYGNTEFAEQVTYSTGDSSHPASIAVGDFNNDNQLDIIVTNSGTNNIGIALGSGRGTFLFSITYLSEPISVPSSITVADLNRDNQLDFVVANWGSSSILVCFGLGNGTFSNLQQYYIGYDARPQSVVIGDFNNDNWLDIAVANYEINYVDIFLQTC